MSRVAMKNYDEWQIDMDLERDKGHDLFEGIS
jgi:hypothetical protein